ILNTQEVRKTGRNGTVPIRNNVSGEQPIVSKLYRKTLPLTGTESSKIYSRSILDLHISGTAQIQLAALGL
ncbi:unnamed protein product, partial [Cercopithifilaria johnstoni]